MAHLIEVRPAKVSVLPTLRLQTQRQSCQHFHVVCHHLRHCTACSCSHGPEAMATAQCVPLSSRLVKGQLGLEVAASAPEAPASVVASAAALVAAGAGAAAEAVVVEGAWKALMTGRWRTPRSGERIRCCMQTHQ
jgi:hypothetical protein